MSASIIDSTLRQISRLTEEESASEQAKRLGLTYANLENYPFNLDVLQLIPVESVKQKGIAPYIRSSNKVRVAIVHPENKELQLEVATLARDWGVDMELIVVSASSMQYLIKAYLQLLKEKAEQEQQELLEQVHAEDINFFKKVQSIADVQKEIIGASTTKIMDVLLAGSLGEGASDVHIEPGEQSIVVRYRVDGVLQRICELPMSVHGQLVSRIKMLASLKLDEKATTQDGRFSLKEKGIQADVRVSTIPTGYGEGVVMRILRQDMKLLSIAELGFSEYNQAIIQRIIQKPYGLILVTGPTGSGKSTTLYAILQQLNTSEKKIITLEDPIEYRVEGMQQSQIDSEKGFGFSEGLRGVLRQDPDIVMVGEIRDPETATIALNASLTGHLVLSTLHTNNAVTAHTRFLEMGIAPFLLTGSIQMVIAQRLIRTIVPGSDPENPTFKGRLVIGEVLVPNQEFEQAVISRSDQRSLEDIAVRGGMVPMFQDGMDKVHRGLTNQNELSRVTTR